MKRRTIITSVLVIVLCLGLISGSTFALFTSESSVNIAVTSGKVNVVATIDPTTLKVYSATTDPVNSAGEAGTLDGTFAGTYYYDKLDGTTFTNGGTVTLTDTKTLKIDKITPGDKVEVTVSVENNSNVKTKYRIKVNVLDGETLEEQAKSLKLFEGLTVNVGTNDAETRTATKLNGVIRVSDWYDLAAKGDSDNLADIPVEIFLPLEAGNEYQDLKTEIQITVEAVQNNAATNTELETINAFLATQTPTTMYTAVKSLADNSVLGLTSYAEAFAKVESYLWNVDTNQFYAESDATDFAYKYFKVYDAMPTTVQTYSIYAYDDGTTSWTNQNVNVVVGFDAGETTGITSVTYNRSTAEYGQDVVIRTNSAGTTLTINAPKDVVKHYGVAGSLDIIAVAGQSYHEFGTVGFIQIAKGRVALEKDSSVNQLHFDYNETAQKFDEIVVAVDSTVTLPKLSRDVVENIGENGTLVVELQDNTNAEQANSDYIWLYQQGLVEQIRISDSNESAGNVKATAYEETTNTYKAADDIANNLREDLSYDNLKKEDGSVPTEDLDGATIQNGGKTEQQKVEDRQAAITDVTQKVCLHVNKNYVSDGSTGHHAVCQDCGKVLIEHELHVFESEDVPPCIKCEYAGNIIKIKVNDTGTENPQSISETMSLSAAIKQYNNYDGEGKDFIIELDDGEYIMTPSNATNDGIIIDQSGINKGHNLTIKAKNMPTSVNDNFNVIIKSANVGNSYLTTTSAFFQVNGCSSTNGGGIITFTGIKFDFTTSGALSGTDYKFGNNRLAAVFLMAGATNRYAHDVTMKLCQFHGPNGKLASAVNSTEHNSNPTRITIRDCKGDGMNSWFNGYQSQYGTLEDNFGLKLINLESDHFLIVANPQSGGDVIIDNVNGSFLTVPGDTLLERWLLKFIVNVNLTINSCNWDLIGNSPDDGSKSKDSCGVIIFVGSSYTAHATISDFVVTRSGLTNKTTSQFPDIRLKDGASLSINGNPAFSNEFTSPYTVQLNNNN